jgi:hypothetical protein
MARKAQVEQSNWFRQTSYKLVLRLYKQIAISLVVAISPSLAIAKQISALPLSKPGALATVARYWWVTMQRMARCHLRKQQI